MAIRLSPCPSILSAAYPTLPTVPLCSPISRLCPCVVEGVVVVMVVVVVMMMGRWSLPSAVLLGELLPEGALDAPLVQRDRLRLARNDERLGLGPTHHFAWKVKKSKCENLRFMAENAIVLPQNKLILSHSLANHFMYIYIVNIIYAMYQIMF